MTQRGEPPQLGRDVAAEVVVAQAQCLERGQTAQLRHDVACGRDVVDGDDHHDGGFGCGKSCREVRESLDDHDEQRRPVHTMASVSDEDTHKKNLDATGKSDFRKTARTTNRHLVATSVSVVRPHRNIKVQYHTNTK